MSEVVEAIRFNNRVEADLARLYLEDHGICSILFDADIHTVFGWFYALIFPIRVMVLDEDLEEALNLLRAYKP